MKKLLLNATFVALAMGTHGYAMQPEGQKFQSNSAACLAAIDEKTSQPAPTPSRLKPALMVAGFTGASLAGLSLLAGPAPISDVFGDSDQVESGQRFYNIQVARQLFVSALAAGLLAGGATYAFKDKVDALVKKIKSLIKSKNPELSQDEKERAAIVALYGKTLENALDAAFEANPLSTISQDAFLAWAAEINSPSNVNQPQGSGFTLDSFLADCKAAEAPVAPQYSTDQQQTISTAINQLVDFARTAGKQQESPIPEFTLDSFLDSYNPAVEIHQQTLPVAASTPIVNANIMQQRKEASQSMHHELDTNSLDQRLIRDAIAARYQDAYAIVPATPSIVVEVPVAQPAVSAPVSSATSATTSSQPAVQQAVAVPAPQVAVATPVIEEKEQEQEPEEQKVVDLSPHNIQDVEQKAFQAVSQLPAEQQQALALTLPALITLAKDMTQRAALARPDVQKITIKKTPHSTNLLQQIYALQETLKRDSSNKNARKQLKKLIEQLEKAALPK